MSAEARKVDGAYVGRDWEVVDEHGLRIWPPPERAKRFRIEGMRRGIVLGCSQTEADGFVAGYVAGQQNPEHAALLALVRFLGECSTQILLPVHLSAQVRDALGEDFYREVVRDG